MTLADAFPTITRRDEALAPHTHLKMGGAAEFFVQPTTRDELARVLQFCKNRQIPLRMLGGGFNLLVQDHAIPGAVVQLKGEAFESIRMDAKTATAAGGAPLYDLIRSAVRQGLGGLETLVGLRGSVGGSVRCNVGDRTGEIGTTVRRVAVLTETGTEQIRTRDELTFSEQGSDLDEPVILWVEFALEPRQPSVLLNRLKKAWILRKQTEPLTHQASVKLFRNPPGTTAGTAIDRAGLARHRVGGVELSERNSNYAVAHPGATPADVVAIIATIRDAVKEKTGVALHQELHVW
jgi:UDP-N-acetylmuramate dehydrogenase